MKVLIVGGGGREHALAWKVKQDDPAVDLVAAPGNPGIATLGRCVAVKADDLEGLMALVRAERPELTIVGPEIPLAAGLVDRMRVEGFPVFGPTAGAARIETSKRFAKELMFRAGVPTARASMHVSAESAKRAAAELGAPVVIKASGLAAGKGVVVAMTLDEANRAIDSMLEDEIFGAAGSEVLVEEFMQGEELSLFAVCDGEHALMMTGAQDHKRLLDGDMGPNTGGMGAYAPVSIDTPALRAQVLAEILVPTLAALRDNGTPFTGLLYAGLMLTAQGPKVVEFNCRFGDPETQALLPLLESSLLDVLGTVARGESLADTPPFTWKSAAAVTTVVAAAGYPEKASTGDVIAFPEPCDDVYVFHAGTITTGEQTVTAGGRVLAVTAVAPTLADAASKSRKYAEQVVFTGRQFRADIGWRELKRDQTATPAS